MKRITFIVICVMLSIYTYAQNINDVLKAAQAGNAEAQFYMGHYYHFGQGVAKDDKKAFEWFSKSAKQGFSMSQLWVGMMYNDGVGTSQNDIKAFEWYTKAAEQNNAEAQYFLARCFYGGKGTSINYEKAFEWFLKSAEVGFVESQVQVGYMYANGIGTSPNAIKAFEWFLKSAEEGNAIAQHSLATCYFEGLGTPQNNEKAFEWFLKSAEVGFVESQVQVGYMYSNGIGVEKNIEEGFRWTKMAAMAGDAVAQANLSHCYFAGEGTDIDYEEAFYWGKKSAEQNQELGYENLANCYMIGSRKDVNKAIECVNKSIELCINSGRAKFDKTYLLRLYNKKGIIYLDEQDYAKAEEMAKMILDVNPQYVDEKDNRLMAYIQTGEDDIPKVGRTQIKRTQPSSDVDVDIPQLGQTNETVFAVIIANENYEEEAQVEYALNDGEIFKTYCKEVLSLPESNIHYRENATLNNILAELDWMKQISTAFGEEAKFIFYYAGHGIPDEASGDAYLLPVDGRGNMLATGYSLNKLYETLGGLTAKSVTVFMDACFSGAVRDGGMMASARGVAIKAKQAAPKGNMIVLSAAQGDETAYPYKEKEHGLFTYYLLKKLQETKGEVTLGELSDYITTEVKKRSIIANGKLQTPIVTSSNSATDWRNWTLK